MKTVTFDHALSQFRQVFQIAASGETVLIERDDQRVALRRVTDVAELDVAPPGYFAEDYSDDEISELNGLASQGPQASLPG